MVKKITFTLIAFVFVYKLTAQECKTIHNDSIEIIFAVDSWPELNNDGTKGLSKFIKENMQKVNVPEGNSKVVVQFCVDTLGYTSNYKIIKSVNSELDNEAIRISKLLKFMHPATQLGKPVNFTYTLAYDFKKMSFNSRATRRYKNDPKIKN